MLTFENGILKGDHVQYKKTPNKAGRCDPQIIVVHDTASSLNTKGVVDWLCNPASSVSAHFVVGIDGEIWQLGLPTEKLWHTGKSSYNGKNVGGTCNSFAVGIEIVNPGWLIDGKDGYAYHSASKSLKWPVSQVVKKDDANHTEKGRYWLPYTDAQFEAVKQLCLALAKAYPSFYDIVPHWQISPGRKQDTNPLFKLAELRSAVYPNKYPPVNNVETDTTETDNVEEEYTHFTTDKINLRSTPSWSGEILAVLPKDFWFTPEKEEKDANGNLWYGFTVADDDELEEINFTDTVLGWVNAEYIKAGE